MTIALWIIAVCSLIRIIQNGIQLSMLIGERQMRKNLNNEFIDSLRIDNREWCADTLKDFLDHNLDEFIKADRKTEPTISKMEQVDKDINVRSKTEPQTERDD